MNENQKFECNPLFDFDQSDAIYWNNTVVYGSFINFLIPPTGVLRISASALRSFSNSLFKSFTDRSNGIMASPFYPSNTSDGLNYMTLDVSSENGFSLFNVTIQYADLLQNSTLMIYNGREVILKFCKVDSIS